MTASKEFQAVSMSSRDYEVSDRSDWKESVSSQLGLVRVSSWCQNRVTVLGSKMKDCRVVCEG